MRNIGSLLFYLAKKYTRSVYYVKNRVICGILLVLVYLLRLNSREMLTFFLLVGGVYALWVFGRVMLSD